MRSVHWKLALGLIFTAFALLTLLAWIPNDTAFDAAFVGGDTTSRVFTTISGAASPTADMADVTGLVTKFVTIEVLEPAA